MRPLLDVNVLIALLGAAHVHHHEAMQWLEAETGNGWTSCPLTQNGCIRVYKLSNCAPGKPGRLGSVIGR